jgi:hypothetical protein
MQDWLLCQKNGPSSQPQPAFTVFYSGLGSQFPPSRSYHLPEFPFVPDPTFVVGRVRRETGPSWISYMGRLQHHLISSFHSIWQRCRHTVSIHSSTGFPSFRCGALCHCISARTGIASCRRPLTMLVPRSDVEITAVMPAAIWYFCSVRILLSFAR